MPTTFQEYAGVVNVLDYGAVGDNSNDDTTALQAAFDAACPGGIAAYEVVVPPGFYKTTAPLTIADTRGLRIIGKGRHITRIHNETSNSTCIATDGFDYSHIEGIYLSATGATSVCFDLNWDGGGTTAALQSNTFVDCFFGGGGNGVRIGWAGNMGSENTFINCFFANCAVAGLETRNANALQNQVIGGNFQGCAKGIYVQQGSVPVIQNVGFQANTVWDIHIENSAYDGYSVIACRSESEDFLLCQPTTCFVTLTGCTQTNANAGTFAECNAVRTLIDNCFSLNGQVIPHASFPDVTIRRSRFERSDWISTLATSNNKFVAEIESVFYNAQAGFIHNQRHYDAANFNYVVAGPASEKTIASGVITVTRNYHTVDTESDAASDDLDTINWASDAAGTDGQRLVLRAASDARTVSITEAGNIKLSSAPFALDNVQDTIELIYDSVLTAWLELGRSDNGA